MSEPFSRQMDSLVVFIENTGIHRKSDTLTLIQALSASLQSAAGDHLLSWKMLISQSAKTIFVQVSDVW